MTTKAKVIDIRALMYAKYLNIMDKHDWLVAHREMGGRRMDMIAQYLGEQDRSKTGGLFAWAMIP